MRVHHDGSLVSTVDPALGDTVAVFARAPGARSVQVRAWWDGEPRFTPAKPDGRGWWRADVEVRNPVTGYRFLVDGRWLTAAGLVDHDVPDATDFKLVAHPGPPAWHRDAVVYEIFPDRFARSAAADRPAPDWAIACSWDRDPVIPRGPQTPRQLYGGDLDGIVDHLDHVADLGANTLYLTPVWPARSNHRYDATGFDRVDPLLGGDAAYRRLVDAVHRRGWRLLGDLTTNHTGDGHRWYTGSPSLYYPDEFWMGVPSLPKLDWGSPELRRQMAGLVAWWTRSGGLDGWRIDVANMTGRRGADCYTREVAALLREAAGGALMIAEHGHDASADLDTGGWHGTMNYAGFTRPLWTWLRRDDLDLPDFLGVPGPVPRRGGAATVATMRAFAARMSWRSLTASWQLLGSHDTPRIRTVVGDAARGEVAAGLLLTLPGTPMIFAGDELGLTGVNGEDSRTPMPWRRPGSWDRTTLSHYRSLIRLRHALEPLRQGGLEWLHGSDDALVFVRATRSEAALVLARRGPGAPIRVDVGAAVNVYGGAPDLAPGDQLPGDGPTFQVWALSASRNQA